jgi:hypothetical protein
VGQDGCGEAIHRFAPLEKALPMSMVGFPLLLIPLAIYNIIVFLMPGVSLAEPLVTLPLPSGGQWPVTLSDALVVLGILMLLFEVIKGARPGAKYLTDHLLSLIVFGAAVAEFLLWPRFATSAFFLLTLLSLVDFLTGVSLRVRRGVPAAVSSGRSARRAPATEIAADVRHEPVVPHTGLSQTGPSQTGTSPRAEEGGPAHSESPALSEPKFGHHETADAPASETPATAPQADNGSQPR